MIKCQLLHAGNDLFAQRLDLIRGFLTSQSLYSLRLEKYFRSSLKIDGSTMERR